MIDTRAPLEHFHRRWSRMVAPRWARWYAGSGPMLVGPWRTEPWEAPKVRPGAGR